MAQTPRSGRSFIKAVLLFASALSVGSCTGDVEVSPQLGTCVGCPPGSQGAPDPGNGSSAGDPKSPNGVGFGTRIPKLSNKQWENTVQALLRLDAPTGFADSFTDEPLDKPYESLAAAELTISGDAWSRYQTAAERVAELVVADDAKLAKIDPPASGDAAARASTFVASFGQRAYRRPLTDSERSLYLALFNRGPELVGGDAFKAGVRLVIEAMLQSPHFVYRLESSERAGSDRKVALSGYEVATRLSYALWNSMPSEELFAAAAAGELGDEQGVAKWASKLLDDPRAREVLVSFHEQTFQVASYGSQDKDGALGFNAAALAPVLKDEARRFFQYVLFEKGGGIAALLTEPVAFVNATTAPFYGLSGVTSTALERRMLDASQRVGLLGQLGFLTKHATRNTSDPVRRGLLVLRKVLCDEPDPPPMMFSLPESMPGLTTREVYEKATACGKGCHDTMINPPGFAFESFDAVGRFRNMEAGKPVDTSGTLTLRDGFTLEEKQVNPKSELAFKGPVELVQKLAALPRVHECYARNWMSFALARDVDPAERGASQLLSKVSLEQASTRALLLELVQLDAFRYRVVESM